MGLTAMLSPFSNTDAERQVAVARWSEKFWLARGSNRFNDEQHEAYTTFIFIEKMRPQALDLMLTSLREGTVADVGFGLKLLLTRATFIQLQINAPALILLSHMCESAGDAVMWLYALRQHHELSEDKSPITLERLMRIINPGWPNERELRELWSAQKVEIAGNEHNLLDIINPLIDFGYRGATT